MTKKPSIALANGTTITVEYAELQDSGALRVSDGQSTYFLSPAGWWSYEPGSQTDADELVV